MLVPYTRGLLGLLNPIAYMALTVILVILVEHSGFVDAAMRV